MTPVRGTVRKALCSSDIAEEVYSGGVPSAPSGFNPYAPPAPFAQTSAAPFGAGGEPSRPGPLRVEGAIERALEQVKRFLFRPFDMGKWFAFGFIAFLAECGEGGSPVPFNPLGGFAGGRASGPASNPRLSP